jgi:hypothetical protein
MKMLYLYEGCDRISEFQILCARVIKFRIKCYTLFSCENDKWRRVERFASSFLADLCCYVKTMTSILSSKAGTGMKISGV